VKPGTTANTRTLRAYAADLLQYARWIIEREVDFSNCRHRGQYQSSASECTECRFGAACLWLDQQRTPNLEEASIDELIEGIESASGYLQSTERDPEVNDPELHDWIHKAHRFLKAQRG
jgi:hypothetical protein